MRALVIGGTGSTGPYVIEGLLKRGYQVTIFHRGTHEVDLPADVEDIHGDPHFLEMLREGLGSRSFDLVVAMYGRLAHIADVLQNHTDRLVSLGGIALYSGFFSPRHSQEPLAFPITETAPLVTDPQVDSFAYLMAEAERHVMESHSSGFYNATHLRLPSIYGPRQIIFLEWSVLRRIRDGRKYIILPEGGLNIESHLYCENAAYAILLCVDKPKESSGQIYNVADEEIFSLADWVNVVASEVGKGLEIISLPVPLAKLAQPYAMFGRPDVLELGKLHHRLMSIAKIKSELGYCAPFSAREGIRRTVQFYQTHPLERGGEIEQRLGDRFDYEAEDKLIEAYHRSLNELKPLTSEIHWRHPYPHPKKPGMPRDEAHR